MFAPVAGHISPRAEGIEIAAAIIGITIVVVMAILIFQFIRINKKKDKGRRKPDYKYRFFVSKRV